MDILSLLISNVLVNSKKLARIDFQKVNIII